MKIDPADRFIVARQNLVKAMEYAKLVNEADMEAEVITKMGEVDEKEIKYAYKLRIEQNMSYQKIGEAMGISKCAINRMVKNRVKKYN